MITKISFQEFIDQYNPLPNNLVDDAKMEGHLFGNTDQEKDAIRKHPVNRLWTMVRMDGYLLVLSGWHFANREGHFLTEHPCDDENIEVEIFGLQQGYEVVENDLCNECEIKWTEDHKLFTLKHPAYGELISDMPVVFDFKKPFVIEGLSFTAVLKEGKDNVFITIERNQSGVEKKCVMLPLF